MHIIPFVVCYVWLSIHMLSLYSATLRMYEGPGTIARKSHPYLNTPHTFSRQILSFQNLVWQDNSLVWTFLYTPRHYIQEDHPTHSLSGEDSHSYRQLACDRWCDGDCTSLIYVYLWPAQLFKFPSKRSAMNWTTARAKALSFARHCCSICAAVKFKVGSRSVCWTGCTISCGTATGTTTCVDVSGVTLWSGCEAEEAE